jgi:uncharacterized membrane protein YraQ (UPF0718 family)
MIEPAWSLCVEIFRVTCESAPYLLLGFALAGLMHEFLPTAWITRHLGRESPRSVVVASLLGAPLPLCSCGVVPAAEALRRKGAGRAPTLAFLVSTPETGIESLALTYGLMGPTMAIVRPLVAVLTALVAGFLGLIAAAWERSPDLVTTAPSTGHHDCHAPRDCHDGHRASALFEGGTTPAVASLSGLATSRQERLQRAFRFGFIDLFDDLARWLLFGLFITGALSFALPDDAFSRLAASQSGIVPIVVAAVLSVPLYLCASSATPIAATLVAKGLSPGAALVFLLIGPATNGATLMLVANLLGRRWVAIYLGSIATVAIAAGILLDRLAGDSVRDAVATVFAAGHEGSAHFVELLAGLVLMGAFILHLGRHPLWFGKLQAAPPAVSSKLEQEH